MELSEYHKTPVKAKVKGAVEFLEAKGLLDGVILSHNDVFSHFGVSRRTGYRFLTGRERRYHNRSQSPERRGRPSKLTKEDIRLVKRLLEEHGWTARTMT